MNKTKATASLMLLLSGCHLILGCDKPREPVALAVVLDVSGSAWENRERGFTHLQALLQGGYLPKGSTLALIRCGRDSKMVWEGRVKGSEEILAAYKEATQVKDGGGTDVFTALELSRRWLLQQKQHGMKRLILTGWADLQADSAKDKGRVSRAFKPTTAMTWPDAKSVTVILFGVADSQTETLRAKWEPSLASITLYGPAHRIRPEDIGLTRGATF